MTLHPLLNPETPRANSEWTFYLKKLSLALKTTERQAVADSECNFFLRKRLTASAASFRACTYIEGYNERKPYSASYEPPRKIVRLNDLNESPFSEIKEACGLNLSGLTELYVLAGRGCCFTSTHVLRPRKQPLTIVKGIPHFTGVTANRARYALSRPAPGRQFSSCAGITKFARSFAHGYGKYY